MPYAEVVGSKLRVTIAATYPNVQIQECSHNFVCIASGGGDSRATLGGLVFSFYNSFIRNHLSSNARLYGWIVHTLELFPAPAPVSQAPDLVGLGGADLMPSQVRALVSWKTALAGRVFRGRTYLPTPDAASLGTDGEQAIPYHNDVVNWANAIKPPQTAGGSIWQLCIYHRRHPPQVFIDPTPVTAYTASDRWATQRRGGDYGRPNANNPW